MTGLVKLHCSIWDCRGWQLWVGCVAPTPRAENDQWLCSIAVTAFD